MEHVIRKKGDRAALLLCVGGLALLVLGGFTKLWVGQHVAEYTQIIRLGGLKSWALMALFLALAATWLLGNVVGFAMAYRLRGHASLRCAAAAAAFGVVAMILANTGIFPRTAREVWTILVWLPLGATIVVFAASALWLRESRSSFRAAATRQE